MAQAENDQIFSEYATQLSDIGKNFYARGWVLGTSGNFSAVISRDPLRLAITASGNHKGNLTSEQIIQIDGAGNVVSGIGKPSGKPSDETKLHLVAVRMRGAGAVLHTHSVWSTLLSTAFDFSRDGGIKISGYEMLKGLTGVTSHEHKEWLPIVENSQDMNQLATEVENVLERFPATHGFLLRGHGLYTWGRDLIEAQRHIEIFEFLLEVTGRVYFSK